MLVAYTFTQALGNNAEGDVIQLEPEQAAGLVEAGILAESTAEDVQGPDVEEAPDETETLAKGIQAKAEEALIKATQSALLKSTAKAQKKAKPSLSMPAQVKVPEFKTLGDFAHCVFKAPFDGSAMGKLMRQKSPTGLQTGDNADGGYLVPPEFSDKIWERIYSEESLLPKTTIFPVKGNILNVRVNSETSRVNGSRWGGLRAYWMTEGAQHTSSMPNFDNIQLQLSKLGVFIYSTDELLADNAYSLETYLYNLVPQEINFAINNAILNGDGDGEPTGIIADTATVVQAAEGSQSATTLVWKNIVKMYSRMHGSCLKNAVWLINQDVLPQLHQIQDDNGNALYVPNNGYMNHMEFAPAGLLYGRPVFLQESCATLGTKGDIVFADLSQYLVIKKDVQAATSIHLRFDYDESVFRFVFRMDGKPGWTSALTPFKGTNTQSYAVVLESRTASS